MKKIYSLLLMLCMANSMLFATDYWVAGELPGGYNWGNTRAEMTAEGNNIYTYSFTAEATSYAFKITACASGWSCGDWGDNGGDYKITCTAGDNIIITFNANSKSISVSAASAYYIAGGMNQWKHTKMEQDASNKNIWIYTFAVEKDATYEFKVTTGKWSSEGGTEYDARYIDGSSAITLTEVGSGSTNIKFKAPSTGDVEIRFDASTAKISANMKAVVADYSVVLIDGDKSSSYDMTYDTEEETPSYNYILRNVVAGVYQFVIKDSKNNVYGWDKHETSPTIELEQGENNHIKFTLTKESNVAFVYDSKDNKVWIFTKTVGDNKVEYYISGTCTPNNWDSPHTLMTEEDADNSIWSYTFDAKAGERYEFKITTGAWHWASNPLYEYKEYNAEFIDKDNSSIYLEGWQTDQYNNISFELQEDMTVKIVFDGKKYKVMAQKACGACLKLELI